MSKTRRAKRPNIHTQRHALAQAYFAQHPTEDAFTRHATPLRDVAERYETTATTLQQ